MQLLNLQAELIESLFSDAKPENLIEPIENLSIYQNNILAALTKILKSTYPYVAKIIGEDLFTQAMQEYIYQYPCRSNHLNQYGEFFEYFLLEYPLTQSFIYLAEIAKFEWACHCVDSAADTVSIDLNKLESYQSHQVQELHFSLNPACQLIQFDYPILKIIAACQHDFAYHETSCEPLNLLIIRKELEIAHIPLSLAEFNFLNQLAMNQSLTEAFAAASTYDPHFKINSHLAGWIKDKILVDCYLE